MSYLYKQNSFRLRRDKTVGWGEVTNPSDIAISNAGVPIVTPAYIDMLVIPY